MIGGAKATKSTNIVPTKMIGMLMAMIGKTTGAMIGKTTGAMIGKTTGAMIGGAKATKSTNIVPTKMIGMLMAKIGGAKATMTTNIAPTTLVGILGAMIGGVLATTRRTRAIALKASIGTTMCSTMATIIGSFGASLCGAVAALTITPIFFAHEATPLAHHSGRPTPASAAPMAALCVVRTLPPSQHWGRHLGSCMACESTTTAGPAPEALS